MAIAKPSISVLCAYSVPVRLKSIFFELVSSGFLHVWQDVTVHVQGESDTQGER